MTAAAVVLCPCEVFPFEFGDARPCRKPAVVVVIAERRAQRVPMCLRCALECLAFEETMPRFGFPSDRLTVAEVTP